jgi:hypothetical protein
MWEALPTAPSVLVAVVGVPGPPAADAPVLVATAIVNGDDSALW